MNKPVEYFKDFCLKKGLKNSLQRDKVVESFLSTERHISTQELYDILRKRGERIGYSTVYRTLKLLTEAGLAQVIVAGDETRFEHKFEHKHHDHFICERCGRAIEFTSPVMERIQERYAKKHNFSIRDHSLIIYGLCSKCQK